MQADDLGDISFTLKLAATIGPFGVCDIIVESFMGGGHGGGLLRLEWPPDKVGNRVYAVWQHQGYRVNTEACQMSIMCGAQRDGRLQTKFRLRGIRHVHQNIL